jgi:hypothetical protein
MPTTTATRTDAPKTNDKKDVVSNQTKVGGDSQATSNNTTKVKSNDIQNASNNPYDKTPSPLPAQDIGT